MRFLLNLLSPRLSNAAVLPYDEKRILELWREAAALGSDIAMFLLESIFFLIIRAMMI